MFATRPMTEQEREYAEFLNEQARRCVNESKLPDGKMLIMGSHPEPQIEPTTDYKKIFAAGPGFPQNPFFLPNGWDWKDLPSVEEMIHKDRVLVNDTDAMARRYHNLRKGEVERSLKESRTLTVCFYPKLEQGSKTDNT